MATDSRTWFYSTPEPRPYYIEERVNHTLWKHRLQGLYMNCTKADGPVLMEGEWWPNLIRVCAARNIPARACKRKGIRWRKARNGQPLEANVLRCSQRVINTIKAGELDFEGEYTDIVIKRPDVSLTDLQNILIESSSGRRVRIQRRTPP